MSLENHDGAGEHPASDGFVATIGPAAGPAAGPGQSGSADDPGEQALLAGAPVTVRRNAGLAALVGAAASAVAIAYLWRASQTMLVLDWALCAAMATLAVMHLSALVDSRTPLVVADDLGVRIRLGHEWRGLPWEAIDRVVVHRRRGLLRDGRLLFAPHSLGRALEGLEGRARRHVALNQKLYGAPLAVPVGLSTRVTTDGEHGVVEALEALALGRSAVLDAGDLGADERAAVPVEPEAAGRVDAPVEDRPVVRTDVADVLTDDLGDDHADAPAPVHAGADVDVDAEVRADAPGAADAGVRPALRSILGGLGTIVSRVAKGRAHDLDRPADADADVDPCTDADSSTDAHAGRPLPLRETRTASRAEVTRDVPSGLDTGFDAAPHPEAADAAPSGLRELRRPGSVDLVFEPATVADDPRVRPIATAGDPVPPLVIDAFVTEPAYDPVIGPDLAAARTRLGLSVDELADRTRIRPHVIESIEVDDFAPCGGDFYARGHLRTLARVLGVDVQPLLASFEERYATAPINARRVFEAELATGMTGSMRSTLGGPNWGLMAGMVLTLVLVWGVIRLVSGAPEEVMQTPPALTGAVAAAPDAWSKVAPPAPAGEGLALTLVAAQADTRVVVTDGTGAVVFDGELVLGEKRQFSVQAPVKVRAADAGAVEAVVAGEARGPLGVLGQPGVRTFR